VFVEVARRGGFRTAAEHLQQTPASISQSVQRFEDLLGVKLFERSTRAVSLTQIGQQFFQRSLQAVADLEDAINDIDDQKDEVSGTLRLTAPYSAGPFFLDDLVARFATQYESVDVEVIYNDKKIDLLMSGVDAAIRSNTLLEQDTHAVTVGPELSMSIVASSDYLDKAGIPQKPQDIVNHSLICYAFGSNRNLAPWSFKGGEGAYVVQPEPKMISNDMRSLVHYAKNGMGLAYVYQQIAAPHVASGDVHEVLKEHVLTLPRYSLNYRSKKHMTKRLRAFIDMAKSL